MRADVANEVADATGQCGGRLAGHGGFREIADRGQRAHRVHEACTLQLLDSRPARRRGVIESLLENQQFGAIEPRQYDVLTHLQALEVRDHVTENGIGFFQRFS